MYVINYDVSPESTKCEGAFTDNVNFKTIHREEIEFNSIMSVCVWGGRYEYVCVWGGGRYEWGKGGGGSVFNSPSSIVLPTMRIVLLDMPLVA